MFIEVSIWSKMCDICKGKWLPPFGGKYRNIANQTQNRHFFTLPVDLRDISCLVNGCTFCRKDYNSEDIGRKAHGRTRHGQSAWKICISWHCFNLFWRPQLSWRRGIFSLSLFIDHLFMGYYVFRTVCFSILLNACIGIGQFSSSVQFNIQA